ncbi:Lrp/AsnC family transcriptional regulator [Weeksella virosa]|uniref:Transcriptional regulator, AsnC family n=1 Tax=Weeksella virosa (strain ATCC 43766 / DSM 16922 / JCM 21250 / CCUG 30538 / CDC 9751 / IAM 14551 / NBRC 16016 / NCTC 11634 / CL345/78) TaxID=865938 RepID=F0P2D0_WEEVC|nr:Lrp/AsnC family transcriptional regulator [Weeksella virosa]ADX66742.1 transcriptional regulator, AsnC family [Weeksella virosa DSM 16922]
MKLDTIDAKILTFLQQDSKITYKQLSDKLNLSSTAIHERIKKLEKNKVIDKYVALVDRKKINKELLVLSHIKLAQHSQESIKQFEKDILEQKEILSCYHVSCDYDYIIKMAFENMDDYRDFMINRLTKIQSIGSTQSTFVISELKETLEYYI